MSVKDLGHFFNKHAEIANIVAVQRMYIHEDSALKGKLFNSLAIEGLILPQTPLVWWGGLPFFLKLYNSFRQE